MMQHKQWAGGTVLMSFLLAAGTAWGGEIQYIRPAIPAFELPQYEGQRYEVLVPDTLDLQERGALCLHAMTSATDPAYDYEIYWMVYLMHKPAMMRHDWSDQVQCKFMEALPLLRIMSGTGENLSVERTWMEVVLHELGPDGLAYIPLRGRPWSVDRSGGVIGGVNEGDQTLVPFYNGRMLSVLTLYAQRDPDGPWREALVKMVDGLYDLAVHEGEMAWYWPTAGRAERGRRAASTLDI